MVARAGVTGFVDGAVDAGVDGVSGIGKRSSSTSSTSISDQSV